MFYLELFSALARHKVDYVLIGGLAVSLHGVERATMDIDLSLAMTPENLSAFVGLAREAGMSPVLPVPLESIGDLALLRQWAEKRNLKAFALNVPGLSGVTLDVLLFPPVAYVDMSARAVRLDIAGVQVRLASIDDLIALKAAAGRPIDLSDIEHLRRIKREERR